MPTKKPPRNTSTPDIPASVDAETGIRLLQKLIGKAEELAAKRELESSDVTAWNTLARDYLVRVFGSLSPNINSVINAQGNGGFFLGMSERDLLDYRRSILTNKVKHLSACIEQLETDLELGNSAEISPISSVARGPGNRKVFVVHGRSGGPKEAVARFLEKLGLQPVILHEQPNAGRTLIEKFSDSADVGFAVVILTGDDEGRLLGSGESLSRRARQNVVFELGYFLGRIGRAHVCALYESGVELPTDYQGMAFSELDSSERWRFDLIRELIAAGFDVDANLAFVRG